MNIEQIVRLLTNSGFRVYGADSSYIYMEDPSCVLRSFDTFLEYAWIIICVITGILLFGWAIAIIRGANQAISNTVIGIRNLVIIFGTLAAIGPILNAVYGDDLIGRGCNRIQVPITELNKLLDARNAELGKHTELYESFDIYDSGAILSDDDDGIDDIPIYDQPYSDAPLPGAGTPEIPDGVQTIPGGV